MSSTHQPLNILYTLHADLETLDFAGPLEILSRAYLPSPTTNPLPVFTSTIASCTPYTTTGQKLVIGRDISITEAYTRLSEFDVLVIPGGGTEPVQNCTGRDMEPVGLIAAYAALPSKGEGKTRWLLSVCTGALFLAEAGVLGGLSATTHFQFYDELKKVCERKVEEGGMAVEVLDERFVVNPKSEVNGLRIITSGGVSCGMDSSLWLIDELAGKESMQAAADMVQYAYREGVVLG